MLNIHDFKTEEDYMRALELRDYFAARALQGMLASGHQEAIEKLTIQEEGSASKGIALAAYGFADAMMEVRNNG